MEQLFPSTVMSLKSKIISYRPMRHSFLASVTSRRHRKWKETTNWKYKTRLLRLANLRMTSSLLRKYNWTSLILVSISNQFHYRTAISKMHTWNILIRSKTKVRADRQNTRPSRSTRSALVRCKARCRSDINFSNRVDQQNRPKKMMVSPLLIVYNIFYAYLRAPIPILGCLR